MAKMRYLVITEDGDVSQTDSIELVGKIVQNEEMILVMDTDDNTLACLDGKEVGWIEVEECKRDESDFTSDPDDNDDEQDDSDPGISERERI